MIKAKNYQVVTAQNGKVATIIEAVEGEPVTPYIVYNGSTSAMLYRTRADVVILDALHEQAIKIFKSLREIAVIEVDYTTGLTVRDYLVPIRHI